MRRWNGWGDASISYPLPPGALHFLSTRVGDGVASSDASFEQALASVPPSRLAQHAEYTDDPSERLLHARGQSLPDWVALRSGRVDTFPDAVAYPTSDGDVQSLLSRARKVGAQLIPYGGGTSVVGHINPPPNDRPTLTIDLSRMERLTQFDATSRLATFEAGVRGPRLEAQLEALGCTLGHFPQSFDYSTLGGWIATRSAGQQAAYYGRIEEQFLGAHVETPRGPLDLPPVPASAAGPDLRHLVLGSEGRLGVLTRVTLRVHAQPEIDTFHGAFFRSWQQGMDAVREIAQARLGLSMLRLSDPLETKTQLALSGREAMVRWADRGLRLLRYGDGRSLLVFGITAQPGQAQLAGVVHSLARHIVRRHGGLPVGTPIGRMWRKSRFYTPYLRNTLWDHGYALDTAETAVPWSVVPSLAASILTRLREALAAQNERVLAFAHLSHVYAVGASVYVTYLWRRSRDPQETLMRWQRLKSAVSEAFVAHGGTISHQHGVGSDHRAYLRHEKGATGIALLRAAIEAADPEGLLNPGKLLPDGD